MVHPGVLRNLSVDPDQFSGFAFGIGIERIAIIKWGIEDIRLLHSNKINFLRQFKGSL
jgi:phenylalanyl-tRNA synthetase alpha chain